MTSSHQILQDPEDLLCAQHLHRPRLLSLGSSPEYRHYCRLGPVNSWHWGSHPVHCETLNNIPALYPLDASSISLPSL